VVNFFKSSHELVTSLSVNRSMPHSANRVEPSFSDTTDNDSAPAMFTTSR
jgi:hypothetical protein